ncbi:fused response regulator/phosphatase [Actinokineospora auranticolor]|uniref:Response regulator receiver domain-containing protein n=1 Tax=Actinokineospora auranticolor TaxID=155976 RepID=A0A2S6GCX4_9PSEU|nr:fused response regulator/phosphatase [Actinokineospora auranticolor]PPK63084.1 response regulator receiver domain-containing protein [Actinokineospora auranticolor]
MTARPFDDQDRPARILVVDDTEASRMITGGWLRRNGHEIIEADTGASALARVRDGVDLVILDVNLPDMSGFEVCEVIKSDPATAVVPVVHVSASHIEASDRAAGLTRGADAYLSEPVDPGELLATVKAALRYYRARAAAENLAARLSRLTAASLEVNAARTFPALVTAATRGAAAVLGSGATVLVRLRDGAELWGSTPGPGGPVALAPHGATALADEHLPDGVTSAVRALPGGLCAALSRTKPECPVTCVAVPEAAVGAPEERDLLVQLGLATAVAAEGLRAFTDEHDVALALQRSLLPSVLPRRPGVTMAARYVPASTVAQVGGDFYEVAELDDRLLVAIGDVTGHSIEAATIMGEVRHALRAYAIEGHGPDLIVERLNAMLRRFHPEGLTTLCVLLLDPVAGRATVANAGHIPPLFLDADGARYLRLPGALLGVATPRPPATTVDVPPGTTVVLMTDGLIERRTVPLDADMERLRASMRHGESPEAICERLLADFGQDKDDDIALLVLRRD